MGDCCAGELEEGKLETAPAVKVKKDRKKGAGTGMDLDGLSLETGIYEHVSDECK